MKLKSILESLQYPDNKYRGIPFWSWNDNLVPEELRWQIGEMKKAGLGGYIMHARAGLQTPYMEEEWMQCIEACIDESKTCQLDSWIYDENGYPSGFAGGEIPSKGVEYQQKFLKFEVIDPSKCPCERTTLGFYKISGSYERIDQSMAESEEKVLHAYYQVNPYYSDLLDEKVVTEFISTTYEVYYQRFKEHFGKGIPGIFTDEPQYGRTAMPWSFILPDKFKEKYGYDILDCLAAFYFKTPRYQKIRYDFWNLVTELFTKGCGKQLGEWCEAHDCKLTGHVLLEEDIRYQTMCCGSAMGFYQYMQIPGIDWLGRTLGNSVILKQVVSVAKQLDRDRVLSEMFAAAGWGASFEDLKRIAEWQYALGVNLICAHLEGYSLRGLRKRDHPPGLFYQANWWKEYKRFNDYFARLGMLLSKGEDTSWILVIHPLRSGWIALDDACYKNGTNPELANIDDSFNLLNEILSGLHLDYHLGDEEMIAEYGSIRDGEIVVGNCTYSTIILPPSATLEPGTVRLLTEFIEGGGNFYAFSEFPTMVNGVETVDLLALKNHCTLLMLEKADIGDKMLAAGNQEIRVVDINGHSIERILHKICRYEEGYILYLVNTDDTTGYEAEVHLKDLNNCYALNLEACTCRKLQFDKGRIVLDFDPSQSYVIIVSDEALCDFKDELTASDSVRLMQMTDEWSFKPDGLNSLTLDYCRLSLDQGDWSKKRPVITVQGELLELGYSADIALEFTVISDCDWGLEKQMYLVIEDLEKYKIEINGKPIKTKVEGWWKDKSFHKVDIRGTLVQGMNTIILRTNFYSSPETLEKLARAKEFEAEMNKISFESEVESIYLLGDFTVGAEQEYIPSDRNALISQGDFRIAAGGDMKCNGELTTIGYPFYSGGVVLEQSFEMVDSNRFSRILFKMERPHAALSKLHVNGTEVKTFLGSPYEVDIKPWVNIGRNCISIELISTDRNLFGPHHHPQGEIYHLGPSQFTENSGWRDEYCFIKFGIQRNPIIECFK